MTDKQPYKHAKQTELAVSVLTTFGFMSIALLTIVGTEPTPPSHDVLAQEDRTVTVGASVPPCELLLTVYPEGRVPPTGNWDTNIDVDIFNQSNVLITNFAQPTNNFGETVYDLCTNNIPASAGVYDVFVRGASHLRKQFNDITAFGSYQSNLDLTAGNQFLTAGETSIIYDNYINGLDLSTQVETLYSADYVNDLNQDGGVNALDISLTVKNIYLNGD